MGIADPAKRAPIFIQLNDMLVNEGVVIPLIARTSPSGASKSLKNANGNSWDSELWNVAEWSK